MTKRNGYTLTEIMVTVTIVGILAVLAGAGVSKYRHSAKVAEAHSNVGKMTAGAAMRYSKRTQSLNPGQEHGVHILCTSASAPVPSNILPVTGGKYQSGASDWAADVGSPNQGFACLGFSINTPQAYQYDYKLNGTTFTAIANGDLDGDGTPSSWEMYGDAVGSEIRIAPGIKEMYPGKD